MKSKSKIKIKRTCIYLDQFAVSNLISPKQNSIWFELKSLLQHLSKEDRIFCPLSHEHFIETTGKKFEQAVIHDAFLRELSLGFNVKSELQITSQLISTKIRKFNITPNTYLDFNGTKTMSDIERYTQLRDKNEIFYPHLNKHFEYVNLMRGATNCKVPQK